MLNLLRLRSVLSLETVSSYQDVLDTLNKAFENNLVVKDHALFRGPSTYKKLRDTPFTIYGPLGPTAMPLLTELTIYQNQNKTVIELSSSVLRALMVEKLILFFFIALCLITVMTMFMLKIHGAYLAVAPVLFWLFGMWVLHPEAQHTKKALEAVILGE